MNTQTGRRTALKILGGLLGLPFLASTLAATKSIAAAGIEKMKLTNNEWKKRLTADQYAVLREEATETPYSSALIKEKREGTFHCVACDLDLFSSKAKYDSNTGWPSFFDSIPGHIETKIDKSLDITRTEFHCARCEGHHGHIFDDGPKPTGLRHCCNGIVLKFVPSKA